MKQGADKHRITENSEILSLFQDSGSYQPDAAEVNGKEFKVTIPRTIPNGSLKDRNTTQKDSLKDSNTILKTDVTTQKDSLKDSNTILKALEPIQAEVLKYIMAHPQATREEIFNLLPACCQECSKKALNMPAMKNRRRGVSEL